MLNVQRAVIQLLCIFTTITSSIIYKKKLYIEMREWMGQPGSTTFECHWKSMERWVGTKNLVFCSDNTVSTLFRNLQRAWSVILSKKRYTLYSPHSGFQCYNYTLTTPHQGASTKPEKSFPPETTNWINFFGTWNPPICILFFLSNCTTSR